MQSTSWTSKFVNNINTTRFINRKYRASKEKETEAFPSDRLYKKHILEVHTKKTKEVQFKEKCDNDEKNQSTSVRRSSHNNTNDSNEDDKTSSHDSKVKKEFSTQEFKEQKEKEITCQQSAKNTSKGKKWSQHKEVENKVHEKENVLQIISYDIQCKPLSNSQENEVKVDVAMETKSPVPKKHGKHFCKKCAMSLATSHVLTKHIQKFQKFGSSQSDHKDSDSDSDIDVLYDADDIPSCVKSFKEEINENICRLCNLKFLTGQMLKLHNSRHHPELNKKTKSEEKIYCERSTCT